MDVEMTAPDSPTGDTQTMKTYGWWDQVPDNLKTKTQLGELHLKPAGPVRARIEYGRNSRHRIYDLYDVGEAVAKVATPAQLAALEQARIAQRTCKRCGAIVDLPSDLSKRGRCPACVAAVHAAKRAKELDATILWARSMLVMPDALILDTETTDLHGYLVEIGIIRMDGTLVYEQLVNPQTAIQASHIHGITDRMVWNAPTFADIELELRRLLHGRTVIVYNAAYDAGVLESEISRLCTPDREAMLWLYSPSESPWSDAWGPWGRYSEYRRLISEHASWWRERVDWQCAMLEYSTFVGDWHDYYRNYRYQPLGGGHRAVGDCRACLEVIQRMAATPLSTEPPAATEEVVEDRPDVESLDFQIDQMVYYQQLEDAGIHPDDDPDQWQKAT